MIKYPYNDGLNIEDLMEQDALTVGQTVISPDYVGEKCSTPTPSPVVKRFTREDIPFCPKCAKKNRKSLLSASQLHGNEYALLCKDKNCLYFETGIGIVPLGEEELRACGYPEELRFYMDVYEDDLQKITRLCIHQYLDKRTCEFSNHDIERDLQEINDEIEVLRSLHGINPKDTSVNVNDFKKLRSFGQLRNDLELSIVDISNDYREKVSSAFSKIKNFNFPESLIVSIKNKYFPDNVSKEDQSLQLPRDSCKLNTDKLLSQDMFE